jgi:acylphosphatase
MRTVRVVVTGMVQGVGFRAWTEEQALTLGLDGWVRNRRDGSVEAIVAGADEGVDALLDILLRGPAGSRVETVTASDSAEVVAKGFRILPTGPAE